MKKPGNRTAADAASGRPRPLAGLAALLLEEHARRKAARGTDRTGRADLAPLPKEGKQ